MQQNIKKTKKEKDKNDGKEGEGKREHHGNRRPVGIGGAGFAANKN